MSDRPLSVVIGRDPEVLDRLFTVKAPWAVDIVDCTFNCGVMWKGCKWQPTITIDIDPEMPATRVADCRDMSQHLSDSSVDVLVFDPPHLPAAVHSANSSGIEHRQYGLGADQADWRQGDTISPLFDPFLAEAHRVLRSDGLVFAKLSDFVHNHAYQWVHRDFIAAAERTDGMTACDLIIKADPTAGNLKSSKWEKVHHFRRGHCFWLVVRKGRCESGLRHDPSPPQQRQPEQGALL